MAPALTEDLITLKGSPPPHLCVFSLGILAHSSNNQVHSNNVTRTCLRVTLSLRNYSVSSVQFHRESMEVISVNGKHPAEKFLHSHEFSYHGQEQVKYL